ncbi:MAG: hypothetical protein GW890_03795 [Vibrio sp.]|nr:hypothetical protein [Vibrio sp.]
MCTQKPNIQPVTWKEAKPQLVAALDDYVEAAGVEIASGQAFPFKIGEAYTLFRAEGSEFVVVGYQGEHTLKDNAHCIVEIARQVGAKTIRVHTQRRGELRFLNQLGLNFYLHEKRPDEFVLKCRV